MRRQKFNLALVPLGSPNIDAYIKKLPDKPKTVLFLDAFDEDARAIKDHRERLGQILKFSAEFRQVLITCRTQFFRRKEEIPEETGILKVGVTIAGEPHEYLFYKLYLSPFSDKLVELYLKRRFHFWIKIWKRKQCQRARKMALKIPQLTVRPMLLAHIQDLTHSGKSFDHTFQLYEEMVEAWLERERPFVKDKAALREFSEKLAVDLYSKAEQRKTEGVPFPELEPLAQSYGIQLKDWQLRSRSLLNRDAAGNYKFAHRSIMEYLFVKRFLDTSPAQRPKTSWTDQMYQFLVEMIRDRWKTKHQFPDLSRIDLAEFIKLKPRQLIQLRANSNKLTEEEVKQMLKSLSFFDSSWNKESKGLPHLYSKLAGKDGVIFDLITGLTWQQSGSSEYINYNAAKKYIDDLNKKGFAGFKDWRLPTLEEAMSLMEPNQSKNGLYIDPIFDATQKRIWTSDPFQGESRAWVVDFDGGGCLSLFYYNRYVRAVRSGQSSRE